ncbi:MAG: TRAP transporter small permease [Pseudomonadota bacterium]
MIESVVNLFGEVPKAAQIYAIGAVIALAAVVMRIALPRVLDGIYEIAGYVAALFLIAILVIICMNMGARWTSITFPGAQNYAGYCMAASSFFALAYALNHGAHIRVSLFLGRMGQYRRWGEIWCYAVAAVTATFLARYAMKTNYWSEKLNDISQGQDAMPLWQPQIPMSIGAVLLAVALWDHLYRILATDHIGVDQPDLTEARD